MANRSQTPPPAASSNTPTAATGASATTAGGWSAAPKRGRRGSTIQPMHGKRSIKTYQVTSGEIWGLFGVGAVAAICFSIAANLFIFSMEIHKDLALNAPIAQELLEEWQRYENSCFNWSLGLMAVGLFFVVCGSLKIYDITRKTVF